MDDLTAIKRGCERLSAAIRFTEEEQDRRALYPKCDKCGAIMIPLHEPPFFFCDCEQRRIAEQGDLYFARVIEVIRPYDHPNAILYLRLRRPNGEIVRLETIEDQMIFYRDPESPQPAHLPEENPGRR